jgi:hypothetical protein
MISPRSTRNRCLRDVSALLSGALTAKRSTWPAATCYEYLITIESQLNDVGDDTSLRGILRFAVDNALKILETQRKQLGEISDQCARYPLSADRAKRATQFVDSTAAILKSIQPRL